MAVLFEGAFAAAALNKKLAESGFAAPDRALCTELVYGTVRTHAFLTQEIERHAPRGISDKVVRVHLLVASYQLLLLERIPAFAAVDEAVSAVKRLRGERVAGFANAVLRKISRSAKRSPQAAIEAGVPSWLREEMTRAVGERAALALWGLSDLAEPLSGGHVQCIRMLETAPDTARPPGGVPGRIASRAFRYERAGDLRSAPGHRAGHFVVQEEGAQFAGERLCAKPTMRVLDACAGRGQKTSQLAEALAGDGELWATDIAPKKLAALGDELARLKLMPAQTRAVDWAVPGAAAEAGVPRDFDRILVDCPCTGSGTLRRRPEIALRLEAQDVERLASLSERILRETAKHLAPTGQLLFVVCSVLHRECEEVVARVADVLAPARLAADPHQVVPAGATHLRLLPGEHGTDGYFMAAFERA